MKKDANILIRVTADEKAAAEARAKQAGFASLSDYARRRLSNARAAVAPVPAATVETMDPVLFAELSAIGNNINQIARAMNRDRDPKAAEIMDQMRDLWRVVMSDEVTARRFRAAGEAIRGEKATPRP